MSEKNDLGIKGEKIAANYLQEKGYVILEKNWRYLKAEIDIIARYQNILKIVEVKTRSTNYFGNPEDFVSNKKKKLMIMAANEYCNKNDIDNEVQFDIVAIEISQKSPKVNLLEGAFDCFEVK